MVKTTIDLSFPGAVDDLLQYHRSVFGGARMEADDDSGSDEGQGDDTDGSSTRDTERDEQPLGDGGKRALEAERRNAKAAAKAARDAEKRAAELEEKIREFERAQMDDQTRTAAERDDWKKKYEESQAALAARDLDILRRDVAAEKGLPIGMARRLNGTTREELESDADELAALVVKTEAVKDETQRTPKPDPSQGVTGAKVRASTVTDVMNKYMADRTGNTTTTAK